MLVRERMSCKPVTVTADTKVDVSYFIIVG